MPWLFHFPTGSSMYVRNIQITEFIRIIALLAIICENFIEASLKGKERERRKKEWGRIDILYRVSNLKLENLLLISLKPPHSRLCPFSNKYKYHGSPSKCLPLVSQGDLRISFCLTPIFISLTSETVTEFSVLAASRRN